MDTIGMRTIDLKKDQDFIDQYIALRNAHAEILLTQPVSAPQTKAWLKQDDIDIRAAVCGSTLLGAAILYRARDGEVACFAKEPHKGIGSYVLKSIEQVARQAKLTHLRAWVLADNTHALRFFEKNGFERKSVSTRTYNEQVRNGIECIKDLTVE
jgi:ribosomal protein S18 acetylase RimI-like enzyme